MPEHDYPEVKALDPFISNREPIPWPVLQAALDAAYAAGRASKPDVVVDKLEFTPNPCPVCHEPPPDPAVYGQYDIAGDPVHPWCFWLATREPGRMAPVAETKHVRPQVTWLAVLMEMKLQANDHKRHFRELDVPHIFRCLNEEVSELEQALAVLQADHSRANEVDVAMEAVDVANFAMMLVDRAFTRIAEIQAKGEVT